MKFLIALAAVLAVASAGHLIAPVATVYGGAQHLPVIGPNGVPVDTAEVQHARAAHLAHKVEAHARNGDLAVVAHAPVAHHVAHAHVAHAVAPVAHAYAAGIHGVHGVVAHQPAAYPTTAVLPSSVNGVPLETPEVVAAKSHHFAAHAEALARNGHVHSYHHLVRRGILAAPLAYSAPLAYGHHYASPVVATSYAAHVPYATYGAHLSLPHHYY